MLEVLKVIILGIVQGITEWLPISSTGHFDSGGTAYSAETERGIYEHVQCGDPVRIYYGGRSNLFP